MIILIVATWLASSVHAMDDVTGGSFGRGRVCADILNQKSNSPAKERKISPSVWRLPEVEKMPGLKAAYDKDFNVPVWPIWRDGIEKLASVRRQVESYQGSERAAYLRTVALVEAALTKHTLVFVTAARPKDLDVKGHVAVLRAIARIDLSKLKLSLYDVKAEIERKLSTTEYLNCI